MLAIFAVASMLLAIATGIRAFAIGTAVLGVAALLIFLIADLPDAGKLGTVGDDSEFTFSTAEAVPQSGLRRSRRSAPSSSAWPRWRSRR